MVVGLQGSGKTTTTGQAGPRLEREGRQPMLAACDLQRPAAVEQLVTLGGRSGCRCTPGRPGAIRWRPAKAAVEAARRQKRAC
jgi:signal recognition particle subunit SRP54